MADSLRLGAHVDQADPLAEAHARGADLVQHFLGDPQGWKQPTVAYADGAERLRVDAQAAGIVVYVHAPYVLNVATANNRIRSPVASCCSRRSTRRPRSARPASWSTAGTWLSTTTRRWGSTTGASASNGSRRTYRC